MRVQHVWAKTGTSPVAFHNTTVDVALCPASERRPVACSPRSKAQMPHIERTRPTLAPPAPLTRMANDTACALVAPPLLRRPSPHDPAPGAPGPRAWRPTARGAIPPVGQPRGPRGDSLVCLGRLRRLWRLRSCRAVPDGRRGRVGSAGAMIVFLLGPVFTAVGVSVFRRGRYATRRAHYDHFVRPRCCAW